MAHEMEHAIIAFDGLSLAGKSTFVQMLYERSENAVVIRENTLDPIRPATARLNELYKGGIRWAEGLELVAKEYTHHCEVIAATRDYVKRLELEGPDPEKRRQAALAYLFTAGRKIVSGKVEKQVQESDAILDRWQVTGWAYQSQPAATPDDEPYTWESIRNLNEDMGIWYPNMQVIVTCPAEQIPLRRAYRQKKGVGTAGRMSAGREEIIYKALMEIRELFVQTGVPFIHIENQGIPAEGTENQIRQAIPHYLLLEGMLRDCIEAPIVGGIDKYRLRPGRLSLKEAEDFFLQPEMLDRIYERQTSRK